MSADAPRLLYRPPAGPDSLAGALLEGKEGVGELLPRDRLARGPAAASPSAVPGREGRGRVPAEALGVSGPRAGERAHRALREDGVFVTTGQQPLLFLGPLYVLYKAVTAVAVADALEEAGVPAVALFWVAGDDHDWDEVARTRLLDTDNRLRELRVDPPDGRRGRAVGPTGLPTEIRDRMDDLTQYLPSSEFISTYLDLLRGQWKPGSIFSEAFGRTLAALVPDLDLVWVDSASPEVRGAEAPLFRRVLREAPEVGERLERGTEGVRAAGWSPQLEPPARGIPLFLDTDRGRRRIYRSGEDFRIGRGGEEVARAQLEEELEERPDRFSPDAALRPVAASWLLPTGVTVLGPAELAYWTQLPPLFGWADVPFPRLRPRDGWTVVEAKIGKVLGKLDAAPRDFRDGGESLARRVREEGRPEAVDRALAAARSQFGRALAEVEESVGRELPGIRSAVGAARHQAFEVLDELASAVDDRIEERHEVVLGQIRKAAVHLWPEGRPQERVLSPLYYLARYGGSFLDELERRTRERAGPGGGT